MNNIAPSAYLPAARLPLFIPQGALPNSGRRDSGEKLETKNIVHRALAKIGLAG
jgi:hypothetical protein